MSDIRSIRLYLEVYQGETEAEQCVFLEQHRIAGMKPLPGWAGLVHQYVRLSDLWDAIPLHFQDDLIAAAQQEKE